MNGKPIPRNSDGLIEKACIDCGKMRYSKHGRPRDRCTHCAKVYRFKNNPAVGIKTIPNMNQVICKYNNGMSLEELGNENNVSAMTIRSKLISHGCVIRESHETSVKQKTFKKAHDKVREMCKTGEFQKNISARLQGIPVEEWKGFITPKNKQLYKTPEYKKWQQSVFERDQHTCQLCLKRNCPIAAHHIYMKAKYPDKVLDVENGITLCDTCHHKTIGHEDEYIDLFISWLNLVKQPSVW